MALHCCGLYLKPLEVRQHLILLFGMPLSIHLSFQLSDRISLCRQWPLQLSDLRQACLLFVLGGNKLELELKNHYSYLNEIKSNSNRHKQKQ